MKKSGDSIYSYAKLWDFPAVIFLMAWFWEAGVDAWEGSHFSDTEVIFMAMVYHGLLVVIVYMTWYARKEKAEREK